MRICPFCLNKIESNQVDYLFEKEFTDWGFMDAMGGDGEFVLNAREDRKYQRFRRMKKLSAADRTETTRVYVDHDELYGMVNMLRRRCGQSPLENVWDENNRIQENFVFEDGEELKITYSCDEEEDSMLEVQSGIRTARASMICSYCHNILPSGFFHYPQLTIGLIGKKDAGKTCMLVSMFANSMKAINRSRVLHFTEAQTMQDSGYRELRRKVRLLEEEGICPDPTRGEFIAPVMLKAEWNAGEESRHAMVCIYDAAGELLEKPGDNAEVLDNVIYTDGWLYLIDPQNTRFGTMVETLSPKKKQKILEKAGIAHIRQQMRMQQDIYSRKHRTVHDIMQQMLSEVNTEAQIQNFYRNLWDCYIGWNLRKRPPQLPEVALILSKADDVIAFLNETYGSEIPLFDRRIDYISAEGKELWEDRREAIRRIFKEYVTDIDNLNADLPKAPDVYLASALGCATKEDSDGRKSVYKLDGIYDPIRVGEAFVRMTMNLMQNRLGKDNL